MQVDTSRPRTWRFVTAALAVALVAAACGGGGGDDDAAPKRTTTTAATPETTAPVVAANVSPLTGFAGDVKQRPALVIKIDNAPKARPQAGLQNADIVIEEAVEGGVTRFMVIYQSQDTDEVGPVRSARSTDIHVATALNHPLFAYSGANAVFEKQLRESPLVNVGPNAKPGAFYRKGGRPAPYNLWGRFAQLYEGASGGPPPPMFFYRGAGEPSASGDAVGGVKFEFRGRIVTAVEWRWDAASGTYRRKTDGKDHVDANGQLVQTRNLVVQFTNYENTGLVDRSGEPVPEGKVIGEGEVWVFTDGKLIKGRWKKGSPEEMPAFTDASGAPIRLTPGQTWVELPKPGTATTF